jgi:hypothetical protein
VLHRTGPRSGPRAHVCVVRETAPPYRPFWVRAEDVRRRLSIANIPRRRATHSSGGQSGSSQQQSKTVVIVIVSHLLLVDTRCQGPGPGSWLRAAR